MPVVEVRNLTKIYERNVPLWRWFGRGLGFDQGPALGSKTGGLAALDDVSFQVEQGEAFGVIGRNGAGKSTLLQLLAGTLTPTRGTCYVHGRVTALLELGSGFNPDFTGRENVYLAGSILGIGKEQMDAKFGEIERFAEIGDFIDQPVRTYSTGMLMRVAFSVAVAVEPDVLIIDEALSVGDILFQQKCNRRMRELMDAGVTLLVVTHDTSFVLNICRKALWLHKGKPRFLGEAGACVREYLAAMAAEAGNTVTVSTASSELAKTTLPKLPPLDLSKCDRLGNGEVRVAEVWTINETNGSSTVFKLGEWCRVVLLIEAAKAVKYASGGCELRDRHGQVMFAIGLRVVGRLIDQIAEGERRVVEMKFKVELAPGQYTLDVGCGAGEGDENSWQRVPAAAVIEVCASPNDEVVHGLVRLPHEVTAYRV